MSNIFSEYGRKARLFPAVLCVAPFLITKRFLIDPLLGISFATDLFAVLSLDVSAATVFIYLLTQLNRLVSKVLFENKSEFPTTLMLLPSSIELSLEYREKIRNKVINDFNLYLPSLEDELKDKDGAKTRIQEVVHLIINKVGKGTLLLQHNTEYGFVRNLLGGSVVALISSIMNVAIFGDFFKNSTAYGISLALSILYLIPIVFHKQILKHYSKEYARILFREYLGNSN